MAYVVALTTFNIYHRSVTKSKKEMTRKKLKNFPIKLILIILILNYYGCSGQIKNKEGKSTKVVVGKVVKNSLSIDSIHYNQYQNEQKHGVWREHYRNGKLKSESNYAKGKKEGLCKEWWETGNLWTAGIYKNGTANGLMKWYNDEGMLVAEGNMVNGNRNGKWKICDVHLASNCIEANFKDEKKVGIWHVLHENGKIWKEQNYKDDKIIAEKCWDEKGVEIQCK